MEWEREDDRRPADGVSQVDWDAELRHLLEEHERGSGPGVPIEPPAGRGPAPGELPWPDEDAWESSWGRHSRPRAVRMAAVVVAVALVLGLAGGHARPVLPRRSVAPADHLGDLGHPDLDAGRRAGRLRGGQQHGEPGHSDVHGRSPAVGVGHRYDHHQGRLSPGSRSRGHGQGRRRRGRVGLRRSAQRRPGLLYHRLTRSLTAVGPRDPLLPSTDQPCLAPRFGPGPSRPAGARGG